MWRSVSPREPVMKPAMDPSRTARARAARARWCDPERGGEIARSEQRRRRRNSRAEREEREPDARRGARGVPGERGERERARGEGETERKPRRCAMPRAMQMATLGGAQTRDADSRRDEDKARWRPAACACGTGTEDRPDFTRAPGARQPRQQEQAEGAETRRTERAKRRGGDSGVDRRQQEDPRNVPGGGVDGTSASAGGAGRTCAEEERARERRGEQRQRRKERERREEKRRAEAEEARQQEHRGAGRTRRGCELPRLHRCVSLPNCQRISPCAAPAGARRRASCDGAHRHSAAAPARRSRRRGPRAPRARGRCAA